MCHRTQNQRESQLLVLGFAQQYYTDNLLNSEEGKAVGLSYFKERGFTQDTIEKFHLGYGLEEWSGFTNAALEKGYQKEYLEKAGLTIVKENKSFDRFRGRVIFPIHNFTGKVIGFGGRILKSDAKAAKYINSPESEIYEKRRVLYGIYYSKQAIVAQDNCLLVEGYTDVISLHQEGVENVVASSGTSLTEDQIRLIKRITNNITILFDGDAAGIKASFRGIDLILEQGLNVKIVLFPDGEDPDSYARKVGGADLKAFIADSAKDFIAFKTGLLLEEASGDPVKKAALIREIVESIAVIPDAIARSTYIHECGKLLSIAEQVLINELNKIRKKRVDQKRREQSSITPDDYYGDPAYKSGHPMQEQDLTSTLVDYGSEPQERDVVRFLLNYGNINIVVSDESDEAEDEDVKEEELEISVAKYIVEEIANDGIEFNHPVYNTIFKEFAKAVESDLEIGQEHFIHNEDSKVAELAIDLIFSPHNLSKNWEERHHIYVHAEDEVLKNAVERTVYSLKMAKVKKMISENREKIKDSEDDNSREQLLQEYQNLLEAKNFISKYLGRVVN